MGLVVVMFEKVGSGGGGGGATCDVADVAASVCPSPPLNPCVKSRSISIAMSCFSGSDGTTDKTDGGLDCSIAV